MGLKSIEMQVALPRTVEAQKMQEQLTRQNEQFQAALNSNQVQEQERKRKQTQEIEQLKLKKEKEEKNHSARKKNKQTKEMDEQSSIEHEYLGKIIDVNG
ncbi:hypothetical protein AB4Y30_07400 [Ornithinibacillus sp. 4-3]|uniref:Uncharacterized protein n=1 Tax=Ornithinibacillus sp. 4-3 TaxID=3231488 RepID=A0AB39HPN6_9BACI